MARSPITYEVPQGPTDIAIQAWNDPWFALGNLAARYWSNQYDERGIGKEQAEDAKSIPSKNGTTQDSNSSSPNFDLVNYLNSQNQPAIGQPQIAGGNGQISAPTTQQMAQQAVQAISQQNADKQAAAQQATQLASAYTDPATMAKYLSPDYNATNSPAMLGILDNMKANGISWSPDQQKSFMDYANQVQVQQSAQNNVQNMANYSIPQTANFTVPPQETTSGGETQTSSAAEPPSSNENLDGSPDGVTPLPADMQQEGTPATPESEAMKETAYATANRPLSPQAAQELHDALAARGLNTGNTQQSGNQPVQAVQPFSVAEWEAQMREEGRKRGRPQYQIDEAIRRLMPQAQAAEDRYNKAQSDYYLMDAIQNRPTFENQGANLSRYQYDIAQLVKLDPVRAQSILAGNPNARDYFTNATEDYRTNRNMKNAETMANDDLIRKIQMAGVNLANQKELAAFTANLNYNQKIALYQYMAEHPELFAKTGSGSKGGKGGQADGQMDAGLADQLTSVMQKLQESVGGSSDFQEAALDGATELLNSDTFTKAEFQNKAGVIDAIKNMQYFVNAIRERRAGYIEKSDSYYQSIGDPKLKAQFKKMFNL